MRGNPLLPVVPPLQSAPLPNQTYLHVNEAEWAKLERWIRLFSWLQFMGVAFGIFLAHCLLLVGQSWTTCSTPGCVLAFHLLEVPLVSCDILLAMFGLRWFSRKTGREYLVILGFANVVNLIFFALEAKFLIEGVNRSAPPFELWSFFSIAVLLLISVGLGLWTQLRMTRVLDGGGGANPEPSPPSTSW